MRAFKVAFWASLAVLTGAWLLADNLWPQPFGYFPFRGVFVQYSGVITMGVMSLAMVLAVRPVWLEERLDGLDKMYRLHKWLGITALVAGTLHWWWGKGTKWMVGWGWLTKPQGTPVEYTGIEAMLRTQRGLAETLGEWGFYIAAILLVLALIKRFPYRLFAKTHNLLAVLYLVMVFHTVVLMDFHYWAQPVGWLMAILVIAGTVSAILVLFRQVGRSRTVSAKISALEFLPAFNMNEVTLAVPSEGAGAWQGHRAGQFAFVTSKAIEGAHPYTISSAWLPARGTVAFVVKALGDHTATLHDTLKVGQPITVQGPYGCFTFDDDAPRQVWIGGGIGITPFLARLEELADQRIRNPSQPARVDLFHTTREFDDEVLARLQTRAKAAGVKLHLLVDARDGYLTPERIEQAVPGWREASFWFCGPAKFGETLREHFVAGGLPARRFHQELFAMR